MKTKEIADICGTTSNVITENGKKLFPSKIIEAGKAVDWTDEEVTVLIDHMQKNPSNNAGTQLISSTYRSKLSTKLTPALKIQQAMLLMKEGYDEEVARLESENQRLQLELDKYVNWKSASEIKSEFKLPHRPGIEKVALLLKLRENEDWIARFYDDTHMYKKILYSPEAVGRIVDYFEGE